MNKATAAVAAAVFAALAVVGTSSAAPAADVVEARKCFALKAACA